VHALVRLHGRGACPTAARLVGANGLGPWEATPLPDPATPDRHGWRLAFAVPLGHVLHPPRELRLESREGACAVPWSPPCPLERYAPAAAHQEGSLLGTGADDRSGRRRLHVLVGVVAWIVFNTEVVVQSTVNRPGNWALLLLASAAGLIVVSLSAFGWVGWNLRASRRRGDRRRRPVRRAVGCDQDALERPIVMCLADRHNSSPVVVRIPDGRVKRYELDAP
jgi:hypothetical protein